MRTFWPLLLFTVAALLVPHALWAQSLICTGSVCLPVFPTCPSSGCPPIPVLPVGGDRPGNDFGGYGGTIHSTTITDGPPCAGDCNGDGKVSVDEIVRSVDIAMGEAPAESCGAGEPFTISSLTNAVANSLAGCPAE